MTRERALKEWRKQRSKFRSRKLKQTKSSPWLFISLLGFSAFLTLGHFSTTINNSPTEQSLSSQSLIFSSSQYQPIQIGSSEDIAKQDFTEIDRLAAKINYQGESIEELANLLAQNAHNELEKARIIYAWITQHISYDVTSFLEAINNSDYPDVSPQKVLRDRTTICSGYSNLYFALASAMDLETVIIFGYAKGATTTETDDDINHAWNGVKIDGNWYLLDATWGSGSVIDEKFIPKYKPYYFATKPSEFIYTHFPIDRGWQLLKQTYSRGKFVSLPNISSRFYDLQLQVVSHNFNQVKTAERINIKLQAPNNVFAIADLYQGQKKVTTSSTLVTRQDNYLIVRVAPPASGNYKLKIYAKKGKKAQKYQQVITYEIQADKPVTEFPKTYGHYSKHEVSLIKPLESNLPDYSSVYFSLKVPYARDVQLVNTKTNQWTALEGYGDYFQGYVDVEPGQNIVVAKFPEDDRYWHLLEYK